MAAADMMTVQRRKGELLLRRHGCIPSCSRECGRSPRLHRTANKIAPAKRPFATPLAPRLPLLFPSRQIKAVPKSLSAEVNFSTFEEAEGSSDAFFCACVAAGHRSPVRDIIHDQCFRTPCSSFAGTRSEFPAVCLNAAWRRAHNVRQGAVLPMLSRCAQYIPCARMCLVEIGIKNLHHSQIEVKKPTEEEKKACSNWPTWGCGVSKFPWSYSERETCLVLEGEVTVTPDGGGEPVKIVVISSTCPSAAAHSSKVVVLY